MNSPTVKPKLRFALLGNPNTGKSTLFNSLTGVRQRTGNYPGVTVERRTGTLKSEDQTIELIDLPGTYSLAARSPDERVAVSVICGRMRGEEPIHGIVVVLDASNLERGLFLCSQAAEIGLPLIVALTMVDIATARGIRIDVDKLESELGTPVIPLNPSKGAGIDRIRTSILTGKARPSAAAAELPDELLVRSESLAKELNAVRLALGDETINPVSSQESLRLLLDSDISALADLSRQLGDGVRKPVEEARLVSGINGQGVFEEARARQAWSRTIAASVTSLSIPKEDNFTNRLDRLLTHRVFGMVIFLAIMALVFQSIYTWAGPLMDLIDGLFGDLGEFVSSHMEDGPLKSLVVDGIIGGVGGVLVFVPQIVILFFFLAILEDSGYMARAAFLMDRYLRKVGLSGRAFIPMLSGFACAIPAIMATRSIPDRASRLTTIMIVPLTSCSARLPVYTLLIAAFVPDQPLIWGLSLQGLTLLCMYLLGIVVAIPVAFIFRRILFRGMSSPFLIELPTYKFPQPKAIIRTALERGKTFVVSAGTVIFAMTIVIWALMYFPRSQDIADQFEAERAALQISAEPSEEDQAKLDEIDVREEAAYARDSILGHVGHTLEPAFRPMGWDWRITTASLASFPAREVVVGTMGVIFSLGDDVDEESSTLKSALVNARNEDGTKLFTIATALGLMVFFALCMQCGASVAAVKRELNSWKWAAVSFSYMTILAYVGGTITYQVFTALGY